MIRISCGKRPPQAGLVLSEHYFRTERGSISGGGEERGVPRRGNNETLTCYPVEEFNEGFTIVLRTRLFFTYSSISYIS